MAALTPYCGHCSAELPAMPKPGAACPSCGAVADQLVTMASTLAQVAAIFTGKGWPAGRLVVDLVGGEIAWLHAEPIRACKRCGCTDDRACPEGCSWVAEDLCSACDGGVLLPAALSLSMMIDACNGPDAPSHGAADYDYDDETGWAHEYDGWSFEDLD